MKYVTVSSERDCIILAPLSIVLATSKARIDILHPLFFDLEMKPPSGLKVVTRDPNVSKMSTALPNPAMLAVPSTEPSLGVC